MTYQASLGILSQCAGMRFGETKVLCWAQMLRNVPDAPQLPACYPAMMILALCPPLFHRIMDPSVAAFSKPRRQTLSS